MGEPITVEVERPLYLDPMLVPILEFKMRYDIPLTPAEAAAISGHDPATLARKRVSGDGPPFMRVGRKVRYAPRSYLAWLLERPQHNSTSETEISTTPPDTKVVTRREARQKEHLSPV